MPPLPTISGREAVRVLMKQGWTFRRQKGSHMMLTKPGQRMTLSVPDHRELDPGLLRSLIRDAGMSVQQFIDLID